MVVLVKAAFRRTFRDIRLVLNKNGITRLIYDENKGFNIFGYFCKREVGPDEGCLCISHPMRIKPGIRTINEEKWRSAEAKTLEQQLKNQFESPTAINEV